ncbi:MAG: SH3 domain-containing protein [Clostridia bacterium]|nr:SH3 domain-containing protein [Clostridia bacterium]
MAVKFNYKKFFRDVINFISDFVAEMIERIRKADKRTLIIGASGVLIAIILVIVLIASLAGGKEEDTTDKDSSPAGSYIQEEPSSDDEASVGTLQVGGAGFYVVSTDSTSSLNMRPTAGTEYSVMATIPNGTKVQVLFVDTAATSSAAKGWGYIEYNGKRGWVSMDYLTAAE